MHRVMLACKRVHGWTFDREMHEDEAKKGRMYVFSLQLERL